MSPRHGAAMGSVKVLRPRIQASVQHGLCAQKAGRPLRIGKSGDVSGAVHITCQCMWAHVTYIEGSLVTLKYGFGLEKAFLASF